MNILFLTSEMDGIAKTGGLADVARALPAEFNRMGHNVRIVMPMYACSKNLSDAVKVSSHSLRVRDTEIPYELYTKQVDGTTVWLIASERYFCRTSLYGDNNSAYSDNGERFAFLTICALECCRHQAFAPYIVNSNDWHTALAPFLLKTRYADDPVFSQAKSVVTVHNGAFQGVFPREHFWMIPELENQYNDNLMQGVSFYNLLKIGVYYADEINTVSEGYAQELTTYLGGHGMSKNFADRSGHLRGIVNGCDYTHWDPVNDTLIPFNYSAKHLDEKNLCKHILQRKLGLEVSDCPMFGMICRLTEQKGINILLPVLEEFLVHKINLVIIGTGDPALAYQLDLMMQKHPKKLVFINDYSEVLAHMVEAGSDFFLMPSLYEPCGLNQLYSMSYGTLPIVRAVGGLRDTVNDYDKDPEHATGFSFERPEPMDLLCTMRRALLFFLQEPEEYARVQKIAMHTRYSWNRSAEAYIKMYEDAHGE